MLLAMTMWMMLTLSSLCWNSTTSCRVPAILMTMMLLTSHLWWLSSKQIRQSLIWSTFFLLSHLYWQNFKVTCSPTSKELVVGWSTSRNLKNLDHRNNQQYQSILLQPRKTALLRSTFNLNEHMPHSPYSQHLIVIMIWIVPPKWQLELSLLNSIMSLLPLVRYCYY